MFRFLVQEQSQNKASACFCFSPKILTFNSSVVYFITEQKVWVGDSSFQTCQNLLLEQFLTPACGLSSGVACNFKNTPEKKNSSPMHNQAHCSLRIPSLSQIKLQRLWLKFFSPSFPLNTAYPFLAENYTSSPLYFIQPLKAKEKPDHKEERGIIFFFLVEDKKMISLLFASAELQPCLYLCEMQFDEIFFVTVSKRTRFSGVLPGIGLGCCFCTAINAAWASSLVPLSICSSSVCFQTFSRNLDSLKQKASNVSQPCSVCMKHCQDVKYYQAQEKLSLRICYFETKLENTCIRDSKKWAMLMTMR